jgi:hypothetical protein
MSSARCAAGEHLGLRSSEGGINGDTSLESAVSLRRMPATRGSASGAWLRSGAFRPTTLRGLRTS